MMRTKDLGTVPPVIAFKPVFINPAASPFTGGVKSFHDLIRANGGTPSSGSYTVDTLRAYPFQVQKAVTIANFAAAVTAGVATSVFRFGIYASTSELAPGTLLFDSGSLSGAAIATLVVAVPGGLTLQPNRIYWLAQLQGVAAPTMSRPPVDSIETCNYVGVNQAGIPATVFWGVTPGAFAFAALPNPFPAAISRTAQQPYSVWAQAA